MGVSAITLDFQLLGANHQRLDQSKNKSLQSEATVIENRFKSNTLQEVSYKSCIEYQSGFMKYLLNS